MTLETRDDTDRPHSIGVDAISLERYSTIQTDGDEIILYDEENDDAWIQSDTSVPLAAVA